MDSRTERQVLSYGPSAGCGSPGISWPIVLLVAAVTSSAVGGIWDISWHMTIGRDTFWTPAHIAIYFGGAAGGMAGGWMAFRMTFLAGDAERAGGIRLMGWRAPFGAWFAIWGSIAMLTAGPFDNWWHNAYGLDVKIISPPHVLLFAGGFAIRIGVLLLLLREQNRSAAPGAAAWLFCYLGALMIESGATLNLTEFWPNRQHSHEFFFRASVVFPVLLVAIGRASKLRWGATVAAAAYMLLCAGLVWVLPLFAATPRLGPIYHPVTHMVPPPFPLWLIVPALAIDLLKRRAEFGRGARRNLAFAAAAGAAFVLFFFPVQWHFSKFYLTRAADNWFFAGDRIWAYFTGRTDTHDFWANEEGCGALSVAWALVAASVSAWFGLLFGNWMTKVQR